MASFVSASKHFQGLLSVDETATDINKAIKEKLEEVSRKLNARFSPKVIDTLPVAEKALASEWQVIKANWHADLHSEFGYKIQFKNPEQLASFQRLIGYSNRLEPLDSDLKDGLAYIVNHPGVSKAFPTAPAWLQLARVLVLQKNFSDPNSLILMTKDEMRGLVDDIKQSRREYYQQQSKQLESTKLPSVERDISALGCRWVKVTQSSGKLVRDSGHIKGQFLGEMEPQMISSQNFNTSLFGRTKPALEGVLSNIRKSKSPNPSITQLLEKLIESAYDENARLRILKELQKDYPPPK